MLHVQHASSASELVELEDLRLRLAALDESIWGARYARDHTKSVAILIDDVRRTLATADGGIAAWQTQALDYAQRALNNNLLTLALSCVSEVIRLRLQGLSSAAQVY